MIKYASPTHAYRALIFDPSPLTFGGEPGHEKGTITGFVKPILRYLLSLFSRYTVSKVYCWFVFVFVYDVMCNVMYMVLREYCY